jgi:hypothetical protein
LLFCFPPLSSWLAFPCLTLFCSFPFGSYLSAWHSITHAITFQAMIYQSVVSFNSPGRTSRRDAINYNYVSCNSFSLHSPVHGCLARGRPDAAADPHPCPSFHVVNSRHDSVFAILTWHEPGNAVPAVNKTLLEAKPKHHVFR